LDPRNLRREVVFDQTFDLRVYLLVRLLPARRTRIGVLRLERPTWR
jgi:hypothetical protein